MKNSKSTSPNSIPTKILNITKKSISTPLSTLINYPFANGTFPNVCKIAKVVPVFKNDSRLLGNNYRPTSLLSNVGKIIEKLMHQKLNQFLEYNECFYPHQYGFRLNISTNNALMFIIEKIQTRLDDNEFAAGVFVDMKKAFDTVDHEILIGKLEHYGVRGTAKDWFCSHLANRKQFVSINNHNSVIQTILTGVPEGSVLGPLVFLIDINDLHNCIKYSRTYRFADDKNILCSDKSLYTSTNKVNRDLKNLSQWLKANKLSLNVKKTELIIF